MSTLIRVYGETFITDWYIFGVEGTDLELEITRADLIGLLDDEQMTRLDSGRDVFLYVADSYISGNPADDEEENSDYEEGGEDRYLDQSYEDRYCYESDYSYNDYL